MNNEILKKFADLQRLQEEKIVLEKEFYKKLSIIDDNLKDIKDNIVSLKLKEININIGDKVQDKKTKVSAFLVGVSFSQAPHTYCNEKPIVLSDYVFRGEYKDIKKDGTIGKKEPMFMPSSILNLEKVVV